MQCNYEDINIKDDMKFIIEQICNTFKTYKKTISVILLISLVTAAGSFIHPMVIRNITDEGMMKLNYSKILLYSSILVALVIIRQSLSILQNCLLLNVRNNVLLKMHTQAFEKLLKLKIGYFTDNNSGEIISRINADIESTGVLFDKGFICMITHILCAISAIVGAFCINWKMASLILASIPFKFVVLKIFSEIKERTYKEYINKSSCFYSWMSDRIMGIRGIKLLNRYKKDTECYVTEMSGLLALYRKISMLDEGNSSVVILLQGIMTGVYYLISGYLVCNQTISIGSVFALISYSGNIEGMLSVFMNIKMIFAQVKPSCKRLQDFLNIEEEKCLGSHFSEEFEVLEFLNVIFNYGERRILKGVALKLYKGEHIAIVGENGSGKSTLIDLLLRMREPDSGKILINGKDTSLIKLNIYRDLFSVVSQFHYLFQDTLRENLDFKGKYSDDEIIGAFARVDMMNTYRSLPQGLDTVVGVNGMNLSGGERQKFAFIQAFLSDAPILIFDEATSNYDQETENWFFTNGLEILENKTVIVVTHQYQFLVNAK